MLIDDKMINREGVQGMWIIYNGRTVFKNKLDIISIHLFCFLIILHAN